MESWLRRAVLTAILPGKQMSRLLLSRAVLFGAALVGSLACSSLTWADDTNQQLLDDVIKPDIKRREIREGIIDTENFEFGFYAGVLSVEDFGSNDVYGIRLAFHITEDWFVEANYGISKLQASSFEELSGAAPLLTEEQRELDYYNLNLGYNLLPGEVYIGRWAFNSAFYLMLGAGNTVFADNEYLTYSFGGGLRLFLNDRIAMHWDVKNHVMTHALFGEDKEIQNLENSLGFTLFF